MGWLRAVVVTQDARNGIPEVELPMVRTRHSIHQQSLGNGVSDIRLEMLVSRH